MKETRSSRLLALAGFLIVILALYLGVLYDTQVVHHEDYLTRSLHSITKEETVDASRGIITDRKGRPLVSNTSTYNLTFDAELLENENDQNDAILRLLRLCQEREKRWEDNLPITNHIPFTYTLESISDTQQRRFLTYLKSMESTRNILSTYLINHSELISSNTSESHTDTSESSDPDAASPSVEAQGAALLDQLPLSAFTSRLLLDAGLTPTILLSLMREEMEISDEATQMEVRLISGVRYELALRKLNDYSSYVLVEDIDTEFISIINDGAYLGAKVTRSSVRQYETEYAAHILGTVGPLYAEDLENPIYKNYPLDAIVGRSGLEAAFESHLSGSDGRRVVSTNSDGKITGEYYEIEPKPGNTVELTIDLELQKAVEDALAETVTKMNEADGRDDRGAGAVVEMVGTGEILALASYPTFDLSTFRQEYSMLTENPANPMFNRATQGAYAPGSTLKPLTAVAALEEEKITPSQKIKSPRTWYYPGDANSYVNCWFAGHHGMLNVSQAITVSCNYFFAEMGYRLGLETLNEYLTAFGLGMNTGVEIGDRKGTLPENRTGENQAPWAAFGQANQLYTPIQLANYVATMVSGGIHCEAHLLKAVKSYDNKDVLSLGNTAPTNIVEMNDATLDAVKKGMLNLTTTGSLSSYFSECVVQAGAKTGTAQISTNVENNGVFICFAPYDDPEIAVSIVIEKGGSGSALASTAVKILNAYFSADEIGTVILPENQLLQ